MKAYAILGAPLPWAPASLAPEQTFLAMLDILPPIAAIAFTASLSRRQTASMTWLLGGIAAASAALGAAQVLSGGVESPLYPHALTNRGLPTGFFANVNHQASFLLVCAPFLLALFARTARASSDESDRRALLAPIALMTVLVLFGVAMAGSVAGWILSGLILLYGLSLISKKSPLWMRLVMPIAGLGSAVALGALVLSSPILADMGVGLSGNATSVTSRLSTAEAALPLAETYFPVGAGFGSFRAVFAAQENPSEVGYNFMNQAHNDWLEPSIEAGAGGVAAVVFAFAFLIVGSVRAWSTRRSDAWLARAASVGLLVLALHSLVDYPLRTSAIATTAAILAMILIGGRSNRAKKRERGMLETSAHRQIRI